MLGSEQIRCLTIIITSLYFGKGFTDETPPLGSAKKIYVYKCVADEFRVGYRHFVSYFLDIKYGIDGSFLLTY